MRDAALEARDTFRAISDIMSDQLATSRASVDQMNKLKDSLKGMTSLEDQLLEVQRQKQEYIEDQIKQGKILNQDLLKRFELTEDLLKKEKERKDVQEQIKDMQSEFKSGLLGSLGTLGQMIKAGSAFGAGMILVQKASEMITSAFESTVGLAKELYTQTGATAGEAARLGGQTMAAMFSMEGLLYGGEALAQAAKDASDYYGTTRVITGDMQKNITELTAMMGDGAGAAQMNAILQSAGGNARELTDEIKNIAQESGVNASEVFKEMGENANLLVGKSKEEIKVLARKTAELKKQGASMELMNSVSGNMLDIESSIRAEMKARAFGMDINTSAIREAAAAFQYGNGTAADLAKTITDQVGSAEEFGKMAPGVQKIYADSVGMTTEQLTELLAKEQTLSQEKQTQNSLVSEAASKAKQYGSATFAAFSASMPLLAQTTGFMKNIGIDAGKALGPVKKLAMAGLAKLGMGGAKAVTPSSPVDAVGGAGKGAAKGGGGIGKMIGGLGKGVGAGLKGIASGFAAFANPATILGVGVIAAGLIGVGFALKLAAPGIKAIGEAISTVVGSLGDFIVKIAQIASPEVGLGLMSLAAGFGSLSLALASFAIAGVAAAPAMAAVGVFTAAMTALNAMSSASGENTNDPLLEEIKGLRADIQSQPIVIKVNDKLVTEMSRANSRMETVRRQHR
jgi:hypothetical protein